MDLRALYTLSWDPFYTRQIGRRKRLITQSPISSHSYCGAQHHTLDGAFKITVMLPVLGWNTVLLHVLILGYANAIRITNDTQGIEGRSFDFVIVGGGTAGEAFLTFLRIKLIHLSTFVVTRPCSRE